MENVKDIIVRTQADKPSIEFITDEGVTCKLVLGAYHDMKETGGTISRELYDEINMCYHKCFGKGYDKKKFVRQMKKVYLERNKGNKK